MIGATEKKLREAEFFYNERAKEQVKPTISVPESFEYLLSSIGCSVALG